MFTGIFVSIGNEKKKAFKKGMFVSIEKNFLCLQEMKTKKNKTKECTIKMATFVPTVKLVS